MAEGRSDFLAALRADVEVMPADPGVGADLQTAMIGGRSSPDQDILEAMVAPKGTHPFTSEESRAAEEAASLIVRTETAKRPRLRLVDHLTYADLARGAPRFAYQGGGKPTRLEPDPGFLMSGTTVVAIPEVKYQKEQQNAVERCFRWLAVACLPQVRLPLDRLIFAFYGDAFRKNARGHICGQGGGVVELCSHLPVRLLVNATAEEFRAEFLDLLDEIERDPTRRAS